MSFNINSGQGLTLTSCVITALNVQRDAGMSLARTSHYYGWGGDRQDGDRHFLYNTGQFISLVHPLYCHVYRLSSPYIHYVNMSAETCDKGFPNNVLFTSYKYATFGYPKVHRPTYFFLRDSSFIMDTFLFLYIVHHNDPVSKSLRCIMTWFLRNRSYRRRALRYRRHAQATVVTQLSYRSPLF